MTTTLTRETLLPVADNVWRVVDARGRALGHVQTEPTTGRVTAKRFHVPSGAFQVVGTFWSTGDAVQSLRPM